MTPYNIGVRDGSLGGRMSGHVGGGWLSGHHARALCHWRYLING